MTTHSLLHSRYEDPQARKVFEQERTVLEIANKIHELMVEQDVSRAELANRLGTSRAHITQVLSGSRNMTLRTVSDVGWALGLRVSIDFGPLNTIDYLPLDIPNPRVRPRIVLADHWLERESDKGRLTRTGEFAVNQDISVAA